MSYFVLSICRAGIMGVGAESIFLSIDIFNLPRLIKLPFLNVGAIFMPPVSIGGILCT